MRRLARTSPIYQGLAEQLAAVSMVPGIHVELSALVTHPLQA